MPLEVLFNIELEFAYNYYTDNIECTMLGKKVFVESLCRKNKFTEIKEFRTERPMCNGRDNNEWIIY